MQKMINGVDTYIEDGKYADFVGERLVGGIDWNGQPYSEGDWVIYAIGAGRGQAIAYGKVLKTILKDNGYSTTRLAYKVQVQTYMTSANWNNQSRTRPAYVNPMNVTALTPEQNAVFDAALNKKVGEQ